MLGILCFVVLDSGPGDASWLSPEERQLLEQQLVSTTDGGRSSGALAILRMPVVWTMCLVCFAISVGMYTVGFWLPTMILEAGIATPKEIGLYAAVPSLISIVPLLATGVSSDRSGERRRHVALPMFVCTLGLTCSTQGGGISLLLAATTLAASGAIVALAQFWTFPTAVLSGYAAAAGIALINSVGNLAGFLSPTMIGTIKTFTGSTSDGVVVMAAIITIGGALCLVISRRLVDRDEQALAQAAPTALNEVR